METSVNNKCRAFTSLEQSKKLAEILPLESADMCCSQNQNGDINYYGFPFLQGNKASNPIPCWSLASLLEQLPYELCDDDGNSLYLEINKEDDVYQLTYINTYGFNIYTDSYKHFVDACYELILKLQELKML